MADDAEKIRLQAAARSITGPYRDHNEDNYFCDPDTGVFVVADGMGGQQAGERASGLAVELLPPLLSGISGEPEVEGQPLDARIAEAIQQVNHDIHEYGLKHPECHQMGTTVVLAVVVGHRMFVSGVGDSRVYHVRNGSAKQVTTDHTVTEALMQRGIITEEQAKVHRFRHVLWRYLGTAELGEPAEVHEVELHPGDRFLLASDGLTGVVDDAEICQIVSSASTPEDAVSQLEQRSQELDSHDNVTCLVLQVEADA